eukprot:3834696-Ditylum_brightwellii.AAC.1
MVGCCLKLRKEQNTCGPNATKSRSVLYHSMKSADAKEDDDGIDECVDGYFNGCVDNCFNGCVGKEDGV